MENLCRCYGGSRMYGLEGPTSDTDERGVYVHTDIHNILGLGKNQQYIKQNQSEDSVFTELRHTLSLLQQGNTASIELLFNEKWLEITPFWQKVIDSRSYLIDTDLLYKSLRGYIQNEKRLVFSENTGKLGSKRKEAVDKYGFSPKNASHCIRLMYCGGMYFRHGFFPAQIKEQRILNTLKTVKFNPEYFTKHNISTALDHWEREFESSYQSRKVITFFDMAVADNLCLEAYKAYL